MYFFDLFLANDKKKIEACEKEINKPIPVHTTEVVVDYN